MPTFETEFYTTTLREAVYMAIYYGDDAVSMADIEAAIDQPWEDGQLGAITHRLEREGIITEVPFSDPIAFVPVKRDPETISWVKNNVRIYVTG